MLRRMARLKWLMEATLALGIARLFVKFVPIRKWRDAVHEGLDARNSEDAAALNERQAALVRTTRFWIRRARRGAPFEAVCLPQALAARWILKRRGVPSQLYFGAKRDEESKLSLHAWLIAGGEYVTGEEEEWTYKTFERASAAIDRQG